MENECAAQYRDRVAGYIPIAVIPHPPLVHLFDRPKMGPTQLEYCYPFQTKYNQVRQLNIHKQTGQNTVPSSKSMLLQMHTVHHVLRRAGGVAMNARQVIFSRNFRI